MATPGAGAVIQSEIVSFGFVSPDNLQQDLHHDIKHDITIVELSSV